ncbi:putative transcription factor WD40-like family [Helianthus anomalus]
MEHCAPGSLRLEEEAKDVTYVTSSGSIVVALGYCSNNVNVVIWDTLIPRTTSRASIMCHEGSVTRISAMPNTIFFLTGSKDGDVKLWDAKRQKLVYHWPK